MFGNVLIYCSFVQTFIVATNVSYFNDFTPAGVGIVRIVTVVVSVLPLLKGWLTSCIHATEPLEITAD